MTPATGNIVSLEAAVSRIRDNETVTICGFVSIGFAEGIAVALEALYFSANRFTQSSIERYVRDGR